MKTIDIIIPIYKNELMTKACIDSILENISELRNLKPRIIAINDSPCDPSISILLKYYQEKIDDFIYIENKSNIGFIKSVNKGLDLSIKRKSFALLVNSDTLTYEGTLIHLWEAMQSDPMIGFACPRSNNSSIATFPHNQMLNDSPITSNESYLAWNQLKKYLPKITFTPTAIGFFLLIRDIIPINFGGLNEDFNFGYEEENDFILRVGRFGYRSVLANHSYAHHYGSASFSKNSTVNYKLARLVNLEKLEKVHPEFKRLTYDFETGPEFITDGLIGGLPNTPAEAKRIFVNAQNLGLHINGTSQIISRFIEHYSCINPQDSISIYCDAKAFVFHGMNKLKNIRCIQEIDQAYAAAIMLGQPFNLDQLKLMAYASSVNIYGMVDVIAEDCVQLRNKDLRIIWEHVANYANGIWFPSHFSKKTFENRFNHMVPHMLTKLYPTNPSAYRQSKIRQASNSRDHILVAGNHFIHKDSRRTGLLLAKELPKTAIKVLGSINAHNGNYHEYYAGLITDAEMENFYAQSSCVVLPSHYEGFGLSLLCALKYKKPIFVRRIEPVTEILSTYAKVEGVFLYESDLDLLRQLNEMPYMQASEVVSKSNDSWDDWSRSLSDLINQCIDDESVYQRSVKRLQQIDLLKECDMLRQKLSLQIINPIKNIVDLLRVDKSNFIETCYKQLLNRSPDKSGINYYSTLLKNNRGKSKILKSILRSEEYKQAQNQKKIKGLSLYKILIKFRII